MPETSVFDASRSREHAVLPVMPTALVEVDVVRQWRDDVPGAVPVVDGESGPDLASAAERFEVDISVLRAVGASAS